MSARYLLDTNILSEAIKPQPSKAVTMRLTQHKAHLATASVVVHEILCGCLKIPPSKRRTAIQDYIKNSILTGLPIFQYNKTAAIWHAEQRARLTAQSKTPSFSDGQIAAIAKTNDLILVTRNVKDFEYFTDLHIENWFEE
jgi:tRNA(fMet)-specific endonuclease VapC